MQAVVILDGPDIQTAHPVLACWDPGVIRAIRRLIDRRLTPIHAPLGSWIPSDARAPDADAGQPKHESH